MDTCNFCDQSGRKVPQESVAHNPELQLQNFIDYRLVKVIAREIPDLARRLGAELAAYVQQTTVSSVYDRWRAGELVSLDGAMTAVGSACRTLQLRHIMGDLPVVGTAVRQWAEGLASAAASEYFGLDLQLTLPDLADRDFPEIFLDVSPAMPLSGHIWAALMRIYIPLGLRGLVRRPWFIHRMTGRRRDLACGITGCMISAGNVQQLSRGLGQAFAGQLRLKMDEICALQEGKTGDADGSEHTKIVDQSHRRQQ